MQSRATAERDVDMTPKNLAEDVIAFAESHHERWSKAQDYGEKAKSCREEMKAIVMVRKIIKETTVGTAMTQLTLRMDAAIPAREEPSAKVKGLIQDIMF